LATEAHSDSIEFVCYTKNVYVCIIGASIASRGQNPPLQGPWTISSSAVSRCPLSTAIKHINSTVSEIIEVVEISLNASLSYELFFIIFMNVDLIKMIFLYKS